MDHRPGSGALLYVSASADGLQAATGYYRMAKDQLACYRHALTAHKNCSKIGAELSGILAALRANGIEIDGAPLKGMPRGVAKDRAEHRPGAVYVADGGRLFGAGAYARPLGAGVGSRDLDERRAAQ